MYTYPLVCPNPKCKATGDDFYKKLGYFKTKHDHQPNPRYECLRCQTEFSSHSDRANKGQKKPEMNAQVFKWVCSGVTINRIAKNLGIDKKTVVRKIAWLAQQAMRAHEEAITSGRLKTSYVQFDEMETFEHTRLKPLSIAIAVRPKTGEIIDIEVSIMNAKGLIAKESRRKYGTRIDTRVAACTSVMHTVSRVAKKNITVACDAKKNYPAIVKAVIPYAELEVSANERKVRGKKKRDPLFAINNLCAQMRADLAPLARKSFNTTKKPERLQDLLLVYMAYVNGYDICAGTNRVELHKKPAKPRKPPKVKVKTVDPPGSAVGAEKEV